MTVGKKCLRSNPPMSDPYLYSPVVEGANKMADIYFDFETRSGKDLELVDRYNYLNDPYADILCLAYRVGIDSATQLWLPQWSPTAPEEFRVPFKHKFYAFNIQFDRHVVATVGRPYGFSPIPLANCIDVMALAARYGYPQSLGKLTRVLNVETPKSEEGTRLINRVSKPCNLGKDEEPRWEFSKFDMQQLCEYCVLDVDSMCQAIQKLPNTQLSPDEQKIWENTCIINDTGIKVDVQMASRIDYIIQRYLEDVSSHLPEWTGGEVTKVTQFKRMREWANSNGADLPDMSKDTLKEIFENGPEGFYLYGLDNNWDILQVLELRYLYGSTSIAKFRKMVNYNYGGRIYGNLRYFGGHTGRESGMGVQIHNLPRDKYEDHESALQLFRDMSILDWETDPNQKDTPLVAAKKLIRSMLIAPDDYMLAVLDYSQIEFVTCMWYAQEFNTLRKFDKGEDMYREFYATLNDIPLSEVTNPQRNFGKTVVLGSIYMMGGSKLYHTCQSYGLNVEEEECYEATDLFRTMFRQVKGMWYTWAKTAGKAVNNPKQIYESHNCKFQSTYDIHGNFWLVTTLASGRNIYYHKPRIIKGQYSDVIEYDGVNGTTKKWDVLELSPGKITENIVQATARDILMHGRNKIMAVDPSKGYRVIASVHDENIVEVPEDEAASSWEHIKSIMETRPEWCRNLPLKVSGYCEKRYRKD